MLRGAARRAPPQALQRPDCRRDPRPSVAALTASATAARARDGFRLGWRVPKHMQAVARDFSSHPWLSVGPKRPRDCNVRLSCAVVGYLQGSCRVTDAGWCMACKIRSQRLAGC